MSTDVDIDVFDRNVVLEGIPAITATLSNGTKHNTGVYLQKIPRNPFNNQATIDYKEANRFGYFKIDILNNTIYADIRDEDHLDSLLNKEPMWELFLHEEIVSKLYHLSNHFDLVKQYAPTTVEELAMVLALIRPAKRHLVGKSFESIRDDIWNPPKDGSYYFKKSHSVAYALSIIVQLNRMIEDLC